MRQRVNFKESWLPLGHESYKSHQRRKDEEAKWLWRLEEIVL